MGLAVVLGWLVIPNPISLLFRGRPWRSPMQCYALHGPLILGGGGPVARATSLG